MMRNYFVFLLLFGTTCLVAQTDSTDQNEEVFTFVDQMPEFPGNFSQYLQKNIKYPQVEKDAGKQGTVYISFVVEKDGSISNVVAAKEVPGAPGLTKEAIRVIKAMPNWKPGMQNGRPVRTTITQPFRFVLDGVTPPICGAPAPSGPVFQVTPGLMPQFPGGENAMKSYVQNSFSPDKKKQRKAKGRSIVISFVVDTLGKICDVTVINGFDDMPELNRAAALMVCGMPAWTPAVDKSTGKKVNTRVFVKIDCGDKKRPASMKIYPIPPPPPPPRRR